MNLVIFKGTGLNQVMKIIIFSTDLYKAEKEGGAHIMLMCTHDYVANVLDFFAKSKNSATYLNSLPQVICKPKLTATGSASIF